MEQRSTSWTISGAASVCPLKRNHEEEFLPEEQRMYSCLDCGRRDFYKAGEEAPSKCIFCSGCLLPMRRLTPKKRSEGFDEDAAKRTCVFCGAVLRSQNYHPVCTARRCWRQYSVLSISVSSPLEISSIIVREYRKLDQASYLRATLVTSNGRKWIADGHFRVCDHPPGLTFEGKLMQCKRRKS